MAPHRYEFIALQEPTKGMRFEPGLELARCWIGIGLIGMYSINYENIGSFHPCNQQAPWAVFASTIYRVTLQGIRRCDSPAVKPTGHVSRKASYLMQADAAIIALDSGPRKARPRQAHDIHGSQAGTPLARKGD